MKDFIQLPDDIYSDIVSAPDEIGTPFEDATYAPGPQERMDSCAIRAQQHVLSGDVDGAGEGFLGGHEVQKRQLELNRAVEVVEKITPALKNRGLVLVLRELVVDVLELDGFRVAAIRHLTDAVRPHPLIGDAVLGRFFLFIRAVGAGNGRFNLFPVGTGQFLLWNRRLLAILIGLPVFLSGEQCHTPPCRVLPAVPARHRSYWS